MQERELAELGIFRIPVPIPFPQAGGPANVYVIEERDGLLMFDAGLGTEASQNALAEGMRRIGHRFQDVNRIVLSHGHVDHFGAAAWVMDKAGRSIPVSVHNADADKVLESGDDWPNLLRNNRAYLTSLGIPEPYLEEAIETLHTGRGIGRRLASVLPLVNGNQFRCKYITLEVHHMPGHTPGLCCLYEREHRLFLSGDHLLENVSPNPLMEIRPQGRRAKPLVSYFKSLERVRSLPIDLVLPGHSTPFTEPHTIIESLSAFYERRQTKIFRALERGPLTVYEVMRKLFPLKSGFELILTMSEALGNLEVLEDKGEVERCPDEGFIRFRRR